MYSNEVRRWERRLPSDLAQVSGMLAAYRDPDPKLGGTPEALPLLAMLMTPYAASFIEDYSDLLKRKGVPAALKVKALTVLAPARELAELLTELSASVREQSALR